MKRILMVLFMDLPYRLVRFMAFPILFAYIIVWAMYMGLIVVAVVHLGTLATAATLLLGLLFMVMTTTFLAERMYRVSYAEELRILGYRYPTPTSGQIR